MRDGVESAVERVWGLVRGARRIADGADALGRRARDALVPSAGLSREGVETALRECLETSPSDAEVRALVGSVTPARAAHVVLSSAVFVAAHRAIALGLAASPRVFVKPSRREPLMARSLADAAPELFTLVEEIRPEASDVVFAYGSDETLTSIAAGLPHDVRFEGHGTGFGVAAVEGAMAPSSVAAALAHDAVLFDQRGCLSPRVVLVEGTLEEARAFAAALAGALEEEERRIPRGALSATEVAEIVRYRDTMRYAGDVYGSGAAGWVGLGPRESAPVVAPVGRNLHVAVTANAAALLSPLSRWVTTIGVSGSGSFSDRVFAAAPRARRSEVGRMQRPAFDGPVDGRGARPSVA